MIKGQAREHKGLSARKRQERIFSQSLEREHGPVDNLTSNLQSSKSLRFCSLNHSVCGSVIAALRN